MEIKEIKETKEEKQKMRKRNMKLFPIYKMLSWDLLFYYTINFLFLTQIKNINASDVVLIDSFYALFIMVLQIPINVIIAFLGKKKSLVIGNITLVIYMLIIIFSRNIFDLILANFISAIGFGIKETIQAVLLKESIPPSKYKNQIFSKLNSKGATGYYTLNMISKVIAGYLFTINGYLPMICSLIILIISTIISMGFIEPNPKGNTSLKKAMGNEEKFQSEAEMFCATYKGSSYIDKVNQLREKLYDVDKAIYCYPETEAMDDDIAQQDVRLMEEKVLEADDLRIHPKDPKITLMVEDREPVTNSMKFKQMLLKSKEKKESKKLQKQEKKAEQQKEQTDQEVLDTPENSDQEENTGKKKWFLKNRMSKKEEEAIEEAFAEQENSEVDRDQLLGEIVNPESDETVAENGMEAEAEPVADPTGDEKKPRSLDELSEDSFEDGVDDFDFDNEEYDSVLMVDVDDAIMPEPSNEHTEEILEEAPEEIISEDITDASDVEKPENVESEEPEKSETDEQQIEKKSEYTESVEDHEITEAETKDAKEPETSESNEEDADSAETPGPAGEDDDSVVIEEVPPNCTVVGVPGRIVRMGDQKVPSADLDQIHLPDPVLNDIRQLQTDNIRLKKELKALKEKLAKEKIIEEA